MSLIKKLSVCIAFVKIEDEPTKNESVIECRCRRVQEASCDGQTLSLECPIGTKIAIHFVQYGRAAPSSQVRVHFGKRREEGRHVVYTLVSSSNSYFEAQIFTKTFVSTYSFLANVCVN